MIRSAGVVRNIDKQGRAIVPLELRQILGINLLDPLEFFIGEDRIIIRKYEPACVFCMEDNNNKRYRGKQICETCIEMVKKADL